MNVCVNCYFVGRTANVSLKENKIKLADAVSEVCMMQRYSQCIQVTDLAVSDELDWVMCSTCNSWYHCLCIGLHPRHMDGADRNFMCCNDNGPDYLLV